MVVSVSRLVGRAGGVVCSSVKIDSTRLRAVAIESLGSWRFGTGWTQEAGEHVNSYEETVLWSDK